MKNEISEIKGVVALSPIAKFEVGKTYFKRGMGALHFQVMERTANFVTVRKLYNDGFISEISMKGFRFKVIVDNASEIFYYDYPGIVYAKDVFYIESNVEDDGSNDDDDEVLTFDYNFVDDEDDEDDELVDEPLKINYSVLSYDNRYKLNGKCISAYDAETQILLASGDYYKFSKYAQYEFSPYAANSTILLVDYDAIKKLLGKSNYRWFFYNNNIDLEKASSWYKPVDLGRADIPFVNDKVSDIVRARRQLAKKEDIERAKLKAYYNSPEYKIRGVKNSIAHLDYYVEDRRRTIKTAQEDILHCLSRIAGLENGILEHWLEIDEAEKDREIFQRQAKVLSDEIATRTAFANINAAAAEMVDDGSNDDPDEGNEVLTLDYNFEDDEDDELIDEAEVITVEEKVIATADLEKELTRIKGHVEVMKEIIFDNNVAIKGNQKKILEYIAAIMTNENAITAYGVENISLGNKIDELEEEAAALEAEILNRKITESYIDSIVTAAAFNASIQAEEMAAANNAEPVTFELERFNDGEIVSGDVAEIETAVSEVPIVDEEKENDFSPKKLFEQFQSVNTEIDELQQQIDRLNELQKSKYGLRRELRCELYKSASSLKTWMLDKVRLGDKEIAIKTPNGNFEIKGIYDFEDSLAVSWNEKTGKLVCSLWRKDIEVASYGTVEKYKAAILELAAAIERGDKKFTFPADDSENKQKKYAQT